MGNSKKLSVLNLWGFLTSILALLISLTAGIGTRFNLWYFRISLNLLFAALIVGAIAAAIALIGIIAVLVRKNKSGLALGIIGFIIAVIVAGVPFKYMSHMKKIPAIHDISTDTVNPPQFAAVIPLRKDAVNPSEYGGPEVAAKQLKAYPDIKTLTLNLTTDQVYDKVLKVAEKMMWTIDAADKASGRIEATATTAWMGFKDDIAIRIAKTDKGSILDIRSVSRVGKSDFGTNAKRVRKFLAEMQK